MPKGISDQIATALKEYERESAQSDKKAILLTPQGGFFLYGNRFCSILEYELELRSDFCQIKGNSVQKSIFFAVLWDKFRAIGEREHTPEMVDLVFHIDLGEDELLRGALLSVGQDVQFALFCDEAVEKLYRLSRRTCNAASPQIPPDEPLQKAAEALRRNDLHRLTGLYLQGRPLKSIWGEEI